MRRIAALFCLVVSLGCRADTMTTPTMDLSTALATTMHVESVDGYGFFITGTGSHNSGSSGWGAEATVTVVDDLGQPVENASVAGTWVVGNKTITGRLCQGQNIENSGLTASNGECRANAGLKINRNVESVTYTVTGITHATLTYDASANVVSGVTIQRPVAP
jgi:hypothetical protein